MDFEKVFGKVKIFLADVVIESLWEYFEIILSRKISESELLKILELNQFTEEELKEFSSLLRRKLDLNFGELLFSWNSSALLLQARSLGAKVFSRLEKIFWAGATDQDLKDYLDFWNRECFSFLPFKSDMEDLRKKRDFLIKQTRKKSLRKKIPLSIPILVINKLPEIN